MAAVAGVVFPGGLRQDGLPAALSDPARLAAVRATGLLDTGPEEAFDDLAQLASTVTGCARAVIALVDERRSFWKSAVGIDPATRQDPVGEGFCGVLVGLGGEPFVVDDAATDLRTRDHPSVGAAGIGAWAGYPVLGPGGEVLGGMYVIDDVPHRWRPGELKSLATLSRAVSNELNLRRTLTTAREALTASRDLARSLQDSLLPPALVPVPGLDVAASYLPAHGDRVVGDFYDLFQATGRWWCTVMGDVCGHGAEAAKVTALARYTLRAEATRHLSPATILANLNTAMLDQRGSDRFLTAAYATFRATAGGVAGRLCTAGHPPALIRRADGRVHPVGRTGTLLGVLREVKLTDVRFRLSPGDTLLLYTDGATEARPPATDPDAVRPQFGEDALARVLAECGGMTAEQVVTHVGQAIARHDHGRPDDDTALLALRVPPPAGNQ
ncbi:SpoIIE family protein phosphatase [Saccharothrix sp. BKS2]|uniref:PP2C family protein-serine/threonine phosphatase n=1 Tax=Saccharothrix sp. BKS2 TaxID=3064400 RepID=UPI0039EB765C